VCPQPNGGLSVGWENALNRRNAMIIAVDFDGILAEDTGRFPEIGPPIYHMISFVRELIDGGHEVVLWTSRTDQARDEAVAWCSDYGLRFCAVNKNAPSNIAKYKKQYPNGTRKISADIYIDDHNPSFACMKAEWGLNTAIRHTIINVRRLIKWIEEN
jgi:hypothetical protein